MVKKSAEYRVTFPDGLTFTQKAESIQQIAQQMIRDGMDPFGCKVQKVGGKRK